MSERVAIVVGVVGEGGRATAEKLAAARFAVVGVDRNDAALKELPDGIRQPEQLEARVGVTSRARTPRLRTHSPAVRPAGRTRW